jgi:hypothetical protein
VETGAAAAVGVQLRCGAGSQEAVVMSCWRLPAAAAVLGAPITAAPTVSVFIESSN